MSDTKKCSDILQYIENIQDNIKKLENELGSMNISLDAKDIPVDSISGLDATNVQQALTKLFQSADSARKNIGDTIGYPVSTTDSFDTINNKLIDLKKNLSNAIKSKGASVDPTSSLNLMVAAVNRINHTSRKIAWGTSGEPFMGATVGFKPSIVIWAAAHHDNGTTNCSGTSYCTAWISNGGMIITSDGFTCPVTTYNDNYWFAIE